MTNTDAVPRPATSEEVARLAGVSRATVSRILNGDERSFPETTRERVRDAAAKLNYRPSGAARSLAKGHSDTIVIVVPDTRFGSHLQAQVDEVAAQTRPFGGNVVVRIASGDPQSTIDALLSLRPFAILNFGVLGYAECKVLTARGVVVVPEVADTAQIRSDAGIARLQLDVLRRNGDRPVWYVATPDDRPEPYSQERLAALEAGCADLGLGLPRSAFVSLDIDSGKQVLGQILAGRENAAVVCYNDVVALTLLAAARELGVEIPGQLAVVGMDDTVVGQLWSPRLTTVHVDMHGFITNLIEELREQLGGTPTVHPPITSFFTLIDGETA